MLKHRVLVLLSFYAGAFIQALPVNKRVGHFFVFWKTASQELLPELEHLQRKTRYLIQHYFEEELVNRTSGSDHSMDSARDLYQRLNLTKFPSDRVLSRENRTNFIFIKGLLKENYRLFEAYVKILAVERRFRCNNTDVLFLCDKTKEIERGLKAATKTIKTQLTDFFHARTSVDHTSRRVRKILAYFNKKRQTDENDMKHALKDSDMGELMDVYLYKRRNRATVGLLYAVYVHLQDAEGTLQYALRLLEPPRDNPSV